MDYGDEKKSLRRRSDRQKELVAKLHSVHENLRKKHGLVTSQEDWDHVWAEHKGNSTELQEYAKAMFELATEVWDPRNMPDNNDDAHDVMSSFGSSTRVLYCRIEWVYLKCTEYFCDQIKDGKLLKLLDVGSCYNPFEKYKNIFNITAIDLCPAPGFEKSVYQCDFLQVTITSEQKTPIVQSRNGSSSSQLVSLPTNYFDIIVFSFFVEYLPDQEQRLESCRRATDLLRPGGILFIIRPDSSSRTVANVRLIKQWKVGCSLLGLQRVYYDKLAHMWCTGYVKLDEPERETFVASKRFQHDLNKMKFSKLHELFAISQDYKVMADDNDTVSSSVYEKDIGLFDELPFSE